jgi:hypothetical protein
MRGDIEIKPVKYSYSFPNIGAAMHMRQYAMQTKLAAPIIFKLYFVDFLSCSSRQYYWHWMLLCAIGIDALLYKMEVSVQCASLIDKEIVFFINFSALLGKNGNTLNKRCRQK